jgi:hypothetical protein
MKVASLPGIRTLVDVRRGEFRDQAAEGVAGRAGAGALGAGLAFGSRSCGQITQVEPHCAVCGEILRSADVKVEPGPAPRPRATTEIPRGDHWNSPRLLTAVSTLAALACGEKVLERLSRDQ